MINSIVLSNVYLRIYIVRMYMFIQFDEGFVLSISQTNIEWKEKKNNENGYLLLNK